MMASEKNKFISLINMRKFYFCPICKEIAKGFNRNAENPDFQVGDECGAIIPTRSPKLSERILAHSAESGLFRETSGFKSEEVHFSNE